MQLERALAGQSWMLSEVEEKDPFLKWDREQLERLAAAPTAHFYAAER